MMKNVFSNRSFTRGHRTAPGSNKQRGQSLVELALTMPVLLLIVAGTVEVTNMITLYNELQLATREAGRLASQGAPDQNLWSVFSQSLLDTAIHTDSADINLWVVRPSISDCEPPVVNPANPALCNSGWKGGSPSNWGAGITENCISPTPCVGNSPVTPQMVWTALGKSASPPDYTGFTGQVFSIVVARFNAPTLLNLRLNLFGAQFGRDDGKFPVYTYVVMRQEVSAQSAAQLAGGCSVYPIAIAADHIDPLAIVNGEGSKWTMAPNSLPGSTTGFGFVTWWPGASPYPGLGESWLTAASPSGSLPTPGNSQKDIPSGNTRYYRNPFDASDFQVRRGGWVLAASNVNGNLTAGLMAALQAHADAQRTLRVLLYKDVAVATPDVQHVPTAPDGTVNPPNPGQDVNANNPARSYPNFWMYQVSGFLILRIPKTGVTSTAVTFEYVREDASCGFQQ